MGCKVSRTNGDVIIADDGLKILTYIRHSWPLSTDLQHRVVLPPSQLPFQWTEKLEKASNDTGTILSSKYTYRKQYFIQICHVLMLGDILFISKNKQDPNFTTVEYRPASCKGKKIVVPKLYNFEIFVQNNVSYTSDSLVQVIEFELFIWRRYCSKTQYFFTHSKIYSRIFWDIYVYKIS